MGCEEYCKRDSFQILDIQTLTFLMFFGCFCFTIRMVPELCWASCCVKLVRYCMYMWLPMYLYQAVSTSEQLY